MFFNTPVYVEVYVYHFIFNAQIKPSRHRHILRYAQADEGFIHTYFIFNAHRTFYIFNYT